MSRRRLLIPVLLALVVGIAAFVWLHRGQQAPYYTGFVEGEERVLRSQVNGRVLEVLFAEGDTVPAGATVARLDPSEIQARIASKQQEEAVLEAQVHHQEEQVALAEATWTQDVAAQQAALSQAEADARLAAQTYARIDKLRDDGVVSHQQYDQARAQRDASRSALDRARQLLQRTRVRHGEIELARRQLDVLRHQVELSRAQLAELEVTLSRHEITAPAVPTTVQAQLLWPGELAQPGTPILAVLDPRDKYVQLYLPASDLDRVRVGDRVEIELDSTPGRRTPGEVSFIADEANFTPEKIETRSDRLGQVYRAKVRILQDAERFPPGAEGNVYLVARDRGGSGAHVAREEP